MSIDAHRPPIKVKLADALLLLLLMLLLLLTVILQTHKATDALTTPKRYVLLSLSYLCCRPKGVGTDTTITEHYRPSVE